MRILSRALAACLLAVLSAACSATPDGDGVASEELTGDVGSFNDGDAVVTTSRLNLRASPSTHANVLAILPFGAPLRVTSSSDGADNPSGSFYHVEYDGQEGWAHGSWLARAGHASPGGNTAPSGGSSQCMAKMAHAATSVDGEGSGGRCYHYVKEHIGRALGVGFDGVQSMLGGSYQMNAWDFARWVAADPGGRASSAGFVRANIPLDQLPLGAILVWRPGQCGYSSSAGHIEINIGGGRACSDFCGHIKTTCGAPTVVVYQKGC